MSNHTFESRGFSGVHHTHLPVDKDVLSAIMNIIVPQN